MQRRKEVNIYEHKRRAHYLPDIVTLCEQCRFSLRGRVEVVEFGAESEKASLACDECGYEMVNLDSPDPRWLAPQTKTWWDTERGSEFAQRRRQQFEADNPNPRRLRVC
jgi:hypothetical protein